MLWAAPAIVGLRNPPTVSAAPEPGLTTIAVWPPLIDDVTVSVAVTERVPAVLRVTLKTWTPESPAVKA